MRVASWLLALAVCLGWGVGAAIASARDIDRQTVARELAVAERLRSCYRISFEDKYNVGERPDPSLRTYWMRIADGAGRVKRELRRPSADMYGDTSIASWSPDGNTGNRFTRSDRSVPQLLQFAPDPPPSEELDEIEVSLGLRFFHSPRRPSEVVGDRGESVIVRKRSAGDGELIEVVFVGPSFSRYLLITHVYDPGRQWALVEKHTVGSKIPVDSEQIAPENVVLLIDYEMTDWVQSAGVWAPTRIHDHTILRPDTEREESAYGITELTSVEINPPLRDEDFIIPTDNLPKGSTVTDARLGISYKIGEDVLYMDGHLNQLKAPVTQVITAATLPDIMKGAVALIDPEARNLAAVGSLTNWWRVGGIILFAAGAAALGAVLWMKRRAAA